MDMPLQLILLSIPSLIALIVGGRRGQQWSAVLRDIGWCGSRPIFFLWGIGVLLIVGGLGWLAIQRVPASILHDPALSTSAYTGWAFNVASFLLMWLRESLYVALGEELFFRGFLGGWLIRRLGFVIGNTIQSVVFLLPHLILLLVSQRLWPLIIVQFLAGWLLGWLRYRSESILPGWFAHGLINACGAFAALR